MKDINFFISFDYFKFNDLKKKDWNNLKQQFIYQIYSDFNSLFKEYGSNINSFHQKLLGNNNSFLFYTGVESKYKEKMKNYEDSIYKSFEHLFNNDNLLDRNINYIKIKIGTEKGNKIQQFSLGCLLLVIDFKSVNLDLSGKEKIRYYFLFPIKYGDFHK